MIERIDCYKAHADLFRALAHPVRLQILVILACGPARVSELSQKTGCKQANISQHLTVLKAARLVFYNRIGLENYYNLVDPMVFQVIKAGTKM